MLSHVHRLHAEVDPPRPGGSQTSAKLPDECRQLLLASLPLTINPLGNTTSKAKPRCHPWQSQLHEPRSIARRLGFGLCRRQALLAQPARKRERIDPLPQVPNARCVIPLAPYPAISASFSGASAIRRPLSSCFAICSVSTRAEDFIPQVYPVSASLTRRSAAGRIRVRHEATEQSRYTDGRALLQKANQDREPAIVEWAGDSTGRIHGCPGLQVADFHRKLCDAVKGGLLSHEKRRLKGRGRRSGQKRRLYLDPARQIPPHRAIECRARPEGEASPGIRA